jgi:hypothetical protein
MRQQYVYVANKSQNPITPTTTKPNYAVFRLEGDGSLTHIDSGVYNFIGREASPAAILAPRNYPFIIATHFFGVRTNPGHLALYVYSTDSLGRIPRTGGWGTYSVSGGHPLGLWQHPNNKVFYAGLPVSGQVGIWEIPDPNTFPLDLTYHNPVNSGPATSNIRTNSVGDHMYALNSGDNSVSVFNTLNPVSPALVQKFSLKNAGPTYTHAFYVQNFTSSEGYSLGLSSNEKFLYVVSQHTNPDFSIGNYNYLHVLSINPDGTLSEPDDPIQLPVPNNVRPRGVAVYRVN